MPPRKRALTVVDPDKPAPKRKPPTLAEAVESGVYLDILKAQQRELVRDVKAASGPAKAAMHRQLGLVSKEIAQLEAAAREEAAEDGEATPDEPFDAAAE